jgi:hypothetical protein
MKIDALIRFDGSCCVKDGNYRGEEPVEIRIFLLHGVKLIH